MGKRILPSGEIVDENDPRVRVAARPAARGNTGGVRSRGGFATTGGSGSSGGGPRGNGGAAPNAAGGGGGAGGPLNQLERLVRPRVALCGSIALR